MIYEGFQPVGGLYKHAKTKKKTKNNLILLTICITLGYINTHTL
jgi:hypothetical protein